MNLANDRDSRVLADVAALGGTFDAPKMHGRTPAPPTQVMAPVGPRHVSGTGKRGDPFVFDTDTPARAVARGEHPAVWTSAERLAALRRAEEADREEARKARRARLLQIVSGARWPGDHPEGEDR
jgi:hypothetical protein